MSRPFHILVVDDEPLIREILRETLEQEGHRVSEAENGKVAHGIIKRTDFDLIITDVKMPVMDGFTLMKQLGSLTDEVPVIVITSFSDIDVAAQSRRSFDRYCLFKRRLYQSLRSSISAVLNTGHDLASESVCFANFWLTRSKLLADTSRTFVVFILSR